MRTPIPDFERPHVVDGFLARKTCDSMLTELSYAFWWPSTVVKASPRGVPRVFQSDRRVSETTDEHWFVHGMVRQLKTIGRQLGELIPDFEVRREKWQATCYKKGGKFDYHFDTGSWANDPAGERQYTVMIILRAPASGGSTHFLLQDADVKAVTGRLVVWSNLNRDGQRNALALHAGLPVLRGRKWILVTWVRQRRMTEH
jgi:prolyl 4-hydroxylase